jgi:DNA adenine methylase
VKPPLTYYGAKVTIAERIVALLPSHSHYVEPFAGSLAVLLAKPPTDLETVNDIDGDLMTFWRVLRDQPDEFERVCVLTPHSRGEHKASFEPALTDMERARRVWVRLTQGRSGTLRRTGWKSYTNPDGTSSSMPRYLAGYSARIPPAAARLARVSLECRPALEVVAAYGAEPRALLYVDPPYLGSVRSLNYQHEMPDEADHRELAEALCAVRATVVLSGYPSPLYEALYAGWNRAEIRTATGQSQEWTARTEVLWSNRPFPVAQMDLFTEEAS